MSFPLSAAQAAIRSGMSTLFQAAGIAATHHQDGAAIATRVLPVTGTAYLGEFQERPTPRHEIVCDASLGARIGDTFTLADSTLWQAVALVSEDNIVTRLIVVDTAGDPPLSE